MKLNSPFLGYDDINTTKQFSGGDEEEPFRINSINQPSDWYYHTANISYCYNEYGHRCNNISDINLDNYILFVGCSHTEGVGVEIEKTYPYIISKELGCDYYNLGIAGSGIDTLMHNLSIWFLVVTKKPKFIFVQWPDETRFVIVNNGIADPHGTWKASTEVTKFIYYADLINFFSSRKELAVTLVDTVAKDSTLITVNALGQLPFDDTPLRLDRIDYARDLSHPGIESHRKLADDVLAYIR